MSESGTVSCSHISSCSLFKLFQSRSFMRIWQIHFCEADFERCARYQLALRGKPIPNTLLPNGKELPASVLDNENVPKSK